MRYFKLENSLGNSFDITNEDFFFHDIEGLGFEEDNVFNRVGPVWKLNSTAYSQSKPGGKIMFTEFGSGTPYDKYDIFKRFIAQNPLTLIYYPNGIGTKSYRKKVRVSKLGKTEITELGVLDCDIEFASYSPWYEIVTVENEIDETDENVHWIWDVGNQWRDGNDGVEGIPRYRFGGESKNGVELDCDSNAKGLIKLTIDGPALNPTWSQYVDGNLISTGGFSSASAFSLGSNERLVIDNTNADFLMTVYATSTGEGRNVYSLRDFDKKCFFNLMAGKNLIVVTSEDGTPVHFMVEGHVHYATV